LFKVNKLSLNLNKTNYILFTKKSKITDNPINVTIDNVPIGKVKQTKFLGVIINEKLTWEDHIITIRGKISKGLGILTKLIFYLPNCILVNLYTLIHPYYDYCNIICITGTSTYLNKLLFFFYKREQCV